MGNCCVQPIDKSKYTEKNAPVFETFTYESQDYVGGVQINPDDQMKEELRNEFGVKKKGTLADIEVKQDKGDFKKKLDKIHKAQTKAVNKILKADFALRKKGEVSEEMKAKLAKIIS